MSKNKLFSLKKNLSTNKTKLNKRLKRIKIKKKIFKFYLDIIKQIIKKKRPIFKGAPLKNPDPNTLDFFLERQAKERSLE